MRIEVEERGRKKPARGHGAHEDRGWGMKKGRRKGREGKGRDREKRGQDGENGYGDLPSLTPKT